METLNDELKKKVEKYISKLIKKKEKVNKPKLIKKDITVDPDMEDQELYKKLMNERNSKRKYYIHNNHYYTLSYTENALKEIALQQKERDKLAVKNYFEKHKTEHNEYCKKMMRLKTTKSKLEKMLIKKMSLMQNLQF
jgi:hypothetical protein